MTAAASTSPQSPRFSASARLPISRLSADRGSSSHIEAVVALVWPYSSSTRTLSLLLAEPDIRLRKRKGQVKVSFRGASAEAVAKSQVGIGDTIQLALEGAQWIHSTEDVSTPGKKIEWDLVFEGRTKLDISRGLYRLAYVDVNQPVQIPTTVDGSSIRQNESLQNGATPSRSNNETSPWSSPAFVQVRRLPSGSFLDASLDPFADDDGFVVGRGRKRTKFARHSDSWQLLDKSPSPEKETVDLTLDDDEVTNGVPTSQSLLQAESSTENGTPPGAMPSDGASSPSLRAARADIDEAEREAAVRPGSSPSVRDEEGIMQPPTMLPRETIESSSALVTAAQEDDTRNSLRPPDIRTPILGPLQSEGLPLISPLIRRHGPTTGYFPDSWDIRSELDASGDVEQSPSKTEAEDASNVAPIPLPVTEDLLYSPQDQAQAASMTDPDFAVIAPPLGSIDQLNENMTEQQPVDRRGSEFEFLDTSPIDMETFNQNIWHIPEASDVPQIGTDLAMHDSTSSGLNESASFYNPPTAPSHQNPRISRYEDEVESITEDDTNLDLPILRTEIAGNRKQKVDIIPETHTETSQVTPVDPNLFTTIESAALAAAAGNEIVPEEHASSRPGNEFRTWQDKLEISAIDTERQEAYSAPPFPFQQNWHGGRSSQRSRRSSQYTSIDGASGEVSAEEPSDDEHVVESSPTKSFPQQSASAIQQQEAGASEISETPVTVEKEVIVLDDDDEEKEEKPSESEASVKIVLDEHKAVHVVPQPEESSYHLKPEADNTVTKQADTVLLGAEDMQTQQTGAAETVPTEIAAASSPVDMVSTDLIIPQRPIHQLITPDSTQKDMLGSDDLAEQIEQERPLPPTPQNTQELADLPQPTIERTSVTDTEVKFSAAELTPKMDNDDLRQRRRSPRLSRKFPPSSGLTEVVSPYFTPRRTSRNQLQDQVRNEQDATPVSKGHSPLEDTIQVIEKKPSMKAWPDVASASPVPVQEIKAGLTTPVSYYTPLVNLSDHFSQTVDVLAICTITSTEPLRSKAGPKDWCSTLHLTDPSMAGSNTITAQLFRPYKMALPRAQPGDVVLLRNVKVQSQKRKCMLLSTESSGWSVFRLRREEDGKAETFDAVAAGPPVEYGPQEKRYARNLVDWCAVQEDSQSATPAAVKTVDGHEPRDGAVYQERSDKTRANESAEVYHELRDGTKYQDNKDTKTAPENEKKKGDDLESDNDRSGSVDLGSPQMDEDSDEESATDQAVSSQIYHELRNGRRYVDPTPAPTGLAEEQTSEDEGEESLIHELRDGVTWVDE